jgi:hypothetical protein
MIAKSNDKQIGNSQKFQGKVFARHGECPLREARARRKERRHKMKLSRVVAVMALAVVLGLTSGPVLAQGDPHEGHGEGHDPEHMDSGHMEGMGPHMEGMHQVEMMEHMADMMDHMSAWIQDMHEFNAHVDEMGSAMEQHEDPWVSTMMELAGEMRGMTPHMEKMLGRMGSYVEQASEDDMHQRSDSMEDFVTQMRNMMDAGRSMMNAMQAMSERHIPGTGADQAQAK